MGRSALPQKLPGWLRSLGAKRLGGLLAAARNLMTRQSLGFALEVQLQRMESLFRRARATPVAGPNHGCAMISVCSRSKALQRWHRKHGCRRAKRPHRPRWLCSSAGAPWHGTTLPGMLGAHLVLGIDETKGQAACAGNGGFLAFCGVWLSCSAVAQPRPQLPARRAPQRSQQR